MLKRPFRLFLNRILLFELFNRVFRRCLSEEKLSGSCSGFCIFSKFSRPLELTKFYKIVQFSSSVLGSYTFRHPGKGNPKPGNVISDVQEYKNPKTQNREAQTQIRNPKKSSFIFFQNKYQNFSDTPLTYTLILEPYEQWRLGPFSACSKFQSIFQIFLLKY